MSTNSRQRRLKNLLEADPHCFWCYCLVTLKNRYDRYKKSPPNMATLDHVISHNSKRWKKGMRNRIVLSCSECNQKRQVEETKALPIEELWCRSGRFPKEIKEEG